MKKLFISLLAFAAATTAFAQNPEAYKELKKTKDFSAAKAIYDENVASFSEKEKADASDILFTLAKKQADPSITALGEGKAESINYSDISSAIEMAYLSDANASKKSKDNVAAIQSIRPALINAANNASEDKDKLRYSLTYVNTAAEGDQYVGVASYFASYAYYQQKDYTNAAEYAKKAFGDQQVNDMAETVFRASREASMKTRQDSLNYVEELKNINVDKYFVQITTILDNLGDEEAEIKMIDEALAKNPQNKVAYFTRGSMLNSKKQYDDAAKDFLKAVEIDPQFIQAWFNLGVCYSQKGFDLNEKYSDKNGRIPTDKAAEVTANLKEAVKYYEEVQKLDPNHEQISNWPMQLRMLYNAVGEKDKADAISKMLGDN